MSLEPEKSQEAVENDNDAQNPKNNGAMEQKLVDESEKLSEKSDTVNKPDTKPTLNEQDVLTQSLEDPEMSENQDKADKMNNRSVGTKHRRDDTPSSTTSTSNDQSSREHKRQDRHEGGKDENTWLFLEESFVKYSPSRKQLTIAQELKTREAIHDFIIRLGTGLKLDGRTILAATIYINRFYMRMPITTSKYFVACAAISIACKLNDNYRQPDMIALAGCKIKNPHKTIDSQSSLFWQWRDQLLFREELILKNLNFELNVELPYSIRDELLASECESSDWFQDKKADALKHAVSLIEILSSLPIIVAYDIYTFFGAVLVAVLEDAKKNFGCDEVVLPKLYLTKMLKSDVRRCYKCYRYILKLLEFCKNDDPQLLSHRNAANRVPIIDEATFAAIAND